MILHPDAPDEEPGEEPSADASGDVAGVPVTETKRGLVIPKTAEFEESYGPLGRPFSRHSPFYVGFWGFLGVVLAYVLYRAVADISGVLLVIGVALFLAVGLEPAVDWLVRRGLARGLAVVVIIVAFLAIVGGFVASAVPPIAHEVSALTARLPRYRHEVATGQGWLGHLVRRLHLASYIEGKNASKVKSSLEGGALGAGKALASATTAIISGIVLTIYFLVALPRVKRMALNLVPASRRERAAALTEETFSRVGGFVLGNLLTSIVSGIGTYIWLAAFGVPYPFLLALFVALFDLIPVIGSTVAGVVVSLVALVRGLPIAIGTASFYIAYRFFEDYLLTPRVMRHTVRISPGLTIIATLIGGTLLGLVGALVAIPCAATIYLLLEEVVYPRMDQA
ncbi:MAG: AI-2E family transporter [Actinomycetota bacterium]|nr:AI-2E family transporter [Actinomycetota bacterium]